MKKAKTNKLTIVFSRNIILFIVIPILAFIVVATGIIRNLMLESAYDRIFLAQESIANTLASEIRDTSIRLSHFLLTNNRQVLRLAEDAAHLTGADRYIALTALRESYNFVVTPTSNTIAIHFYTADGQIMALKDDAALPVSEIRAFDFYGKALREPEACHVGLIPASITYEALRSDATKKAIAVAFSPEGSPAGDNVEMVCWYAHTTAEKMIHDYSDDGSQGSIYLIDEGGNILIGPPGHDGDILPLAVFTAYADGKSQYTDKNNKLNYNVIPVFGTEWKLVSAVDDTALLENFNRVMAGLILLSMAVFALFSLYSIIFMRNIIRPINHLIAGMEQVEDGNLSIKLELAGNTEICALIASFNSMVKRIEELIRSNEHQQSEKHRAEMEALQSQINPHFLINTLNSIQLLATIAKYDNIRKMVESLIRILSASFKWDGALCRVSDEIELLKSYIYLTKIRYPEEFAIEWDIDEKCLDYGIPRLILQPIVENAIVHGFEGETEPGLIRVSARERESVIEFAVTDTGKGMAPDLIEALLRGHPAKSSGKHSIGIVNVNRRVKLRFGEEYGIDIQSETGMGSCVKLTVPKLALNTKSDETIVRGQGHV
jgi:two-component system sensor histidine kinase YesM